MTFAKETSCPSTNSGSPLVDNNSQLGVAVPDLLFVSFVEPLHGTSYLTGHKDDDVPDIQGLSLETAGTPAQVLCNTFEPVLTKDSQISTTLEGRVLWMNPIGKST